jgi:hypothetical protein
MKHGGCVNWVIPTLTPSSYGSGRLWLRQEVRRRLLSGGPASSAAARSRATALDPLLNVVGTLAGSELDDAKVSEAALVERIFLDDRLNLGPTASHRKNDPAIARDLSTGDQEMSGRVVLLQEADVRVHVRVDVGEGCLVDEFDDVHRRPACLNHASA